MEVESKYKLNAKKANVRKETKDDTGPFESDTEKKIAILDRDEDTIEDEKEIFQGRKSLLRTPPKLEEREDVFSTPLGQIRSDTGYEKGQADDSQTGPANTLQSSGKERPTIDKKRGREDETLSPQDRKKERREANKREITQREAVMKRIKTIANNLAKMARENQNTRRDLKEQIHRLQHATEDMEKLYSLEPEVEEKLVESKECQTEEGAVKERRSIATQTDCDEERSNERAEALRKFLGSNMDEADIIRAVQEDWPEELYSRTRKIENSILNSEDDRNILIIMDAGEGKEHPLLQKLARQQQWLKSPLSKGVPQGGGMISSKRECTIETNAEEARSSYQHTFIAGVEASSPEQTIKVVSQIVAEVKGRTGPSKNLGVTCSTEDLQNTLRKICEIKYWEDEIQIDIHVRKQTHKNNQGMQRTGEWRKVKSNDLEVIELKLPQGSNKTYAEMLREAKAAVNLEELGIEVKGVTKTKEGNARIKLKKAGDGKALAFKRVIEDKLGESVCADLLTKNKTIVLRGLFEDTLECEIMEALQKQTEMLHTDMGRVSVKILPMKSNRGTQTVMVTLPAEQASKLLRKDTLKIGWNICRVEEIYTPPKCYRCQGYGHLARTCDENTKVAGKCLKCMEEGHSAKGCQGTAKCYECNITGHQAGTMGCPKYRKLVAEWKKSRKAETPKVTGKCYECGEAGHGAGNKSCPKYTEKTEEWRKKGGGTGLRK